MSTKQQVEFRNIGGSFQFSAAKPEDLPAILDLDPALWAALAAPTAGLIIDRRFLNYLDSDKNGIVCVDELCAAIRFCLKYLKEISPLGEETPGLSVAVLNDTPGDCETLQTFIAKLSDELVKDGRLQPDLVFGKLTEVLASPFKGDGVLTPAAIAGSGTEALYNAVLAYSGGAPSADGSAKGVTLPQLEKFKTDAQAFLDWAATAECPKFRDEDPVGLYDTFHKLENKLDEYFSFCDLVCLDAANLKRFQIDPAALPQLDLQDPAAVSAALATAALALPRTDGVLDFTGNLNPFYQAALEKFSEAFRCETMNKAQYLQIKQDFAPYVDYLGKAHGNTIGALGREKIIELMTEKEENILRDLFARDSRQGGVLQNLRTLDMLVLYKQHLMNFINNFVSFRALFSPDSRSLLQAGKLVMDGHSYYLTLVIPSIAAHKTIAQASSLCMLYLEMKPNEPTGGAPIFVAVAVTGGDLVRIYKGKPAYFISNTGKHYYGKVVDVVEGPISFWHTVFAPFRRLSALLGEKLQKITDFSSVEKQLANTVETGKLPPSQPPPQKSGLFSGGNGSMFLLAGGLSLAAVGAAFSYLVKSIASLIETISRMSAWALIGIVLAIFLFIFIPLAINAILRMRRRNLTLFLEAAGWAINLPMRLSFSVSSLFTRGGVYPVGTKFNRTEWVKDASRFSWSSFFFWLLLALAIAGLATAYYMTH